MRVCNAAGDMWTEGCVSLPNEIIKNNVGWLTATVATCRWNEMFLKPVIRNPVFECGHRGLETADHYGTVLALLEAEAFELLQRSFFRKLPIQMDIGNHFDQRSVPNG